LGLNKKGNTLLENEMIGNITSTEDTAALDDSYSNFLKSMQLNDATQEIGSLEFYSRKNALKISCENLLVRLYTDSTMHVYH
jgi:hypothetical protein